QVLPLRSSCLPGEQRRTKREVRRQHVELELPRLDVRVLHVHAVEEVGAAVHRLGEDARPKFLCLKKDVGAGERLVEEENREIDALAPGQLQRLNKPLWPFTGAA